MLDRLSKDFSFAVWANAFKIVFVLDNESLTEFREMNKTSGGKLELKKGFPNEFSVEYQNEWSDEVSKYTLERSSI
ncbi:hypothetical protein DdX_19913 [Ditylenchus destructor]|uniref:Uncharacterized protein n=1 Tax=Ditylenchus destructor TaxID=166010 RepID=A0AAD4MLR4_9BILA|nr:hypothetical protein DdX_19913 [Ditylenchus destructor]